MATDSPFLTIVVSAPRDHEPLGLSNFSGNEFRTRFCSKKIVDKVEIPCFGNVSISRNQGAKKSSADWILFLDGDCEMGPDEIQLVTSHIEGIAQFRDVIWGALYRPTKGSNAWSRAYNWIQRAWVQWSKTERGYQNLLGGFLLINRKAFLGLSGFDERIPWAGEETEFLRRARSLGFRLELIPGLEINHEKNLSFLGFLRRALKQGWSRGRYSLRTKKPSLSHLMHWMLSARAMPGLVEAPLVCLFIVLNWTASFFGRLWFRGESFSALEMPIPQNIDLRSALSIRDAQL